MTHKALSLKFVIPTVLAIALAIVISIDAVHFTDKHAVAIDQADADHAVAGSSEIAAQPKPDFQLSRVRLLLSTMK